MVNPYRRLDSSAIVRMRSDEDKAFHAPVPCPGTADASLVFCLGACGRAFVRRRDCTAARGHQRRRAKSATGYATGSSACDSTSCPGSYFSTCCCGRSASNRSPNGPTPGGSCRPRRRSSSRSPGRAWSSGRCCRPPDHGGVHHHRTAVPPVLVTARSVDCPRGARAPAPA